MKNALYLDLLNYTQKICAGNAFFEAPVAIIKLSMSLLTFYFLL